MLSRSIVQDTLPFLELREVLVLWKTSTAIRASLELALTMALVAAHNNQSPLFHKPAEQESSAYMAGYMAGAIAAESHFMSRLFRLDVQKDNFATDQAAFFSSTAARK
jgi:hypothetical protein